MINPSTKNLFALYGGVKDFKTFEYKQIEAFDNLLLFLEKSLSDLKNSTYKDDYLLSEIEKFKVKIPNLMNQRDKYKSYIQRSVRHLEESNKEKSPHKSLRESLNINHDNLQKIKLPNALNQIWKLLQENNPVLENNELDDFFQLKNLIGSEQEYYIFQKVNQIYTILNLIGYYKDEGLHKEKRFIASFSDMSHASYGCFCEYLITRDEAFAQKTNVAYEYLNIATQVFWLKLK